MPARKAPRPKAPKKPPSPKTFTAHGHRVSVRESARAVAITIDGQLIPMVRKLAGGDYHSLFLPFRGYPSATALARALASQVGTTLVLGEADTPPHAAAKAKKRTTRGRS